MLIVDAANVVGSRPDGWWRDRAGAAGRLVDAVRAAVDAGRLPAPVVVVLEGAARAGVAAGDDGGVRIVHAPGEGDDTLAALAAASSGFAGAAGAADAADAAGAVTVVTADRALAARVREAGADVVGPRWLLDRV